MRHLQCLIAIIFAGAAMGQSQGSFSPIGKMSAPRTFHTATLLRDGSVLIAGGDDDSATGARTARLSSVELYDPSSQTFIPLGNMTAARSLHTATLLRDGRVLIVGGDSDVPARPGDPPVKGSAELFDPATGTLTPTGSMITGRIGFNATLLADGRVLITGGISDYTNDPVIGGPEIYDPASGAFSIASPYVGALASLKGIEGFASTSTLLYDGTVLFATEPSAEIYDPATGAFRLSGAMLTGSGLPYIVGRTATRLIKGSVLISGGEQEDTGRFNDAELYDPASGAFIPTGKMIHARDGHAATLMADQTVLMTGGESQVCAGNGCFFSGSEASAELYDPVSGSFTAAGAMTERREWHTATLLFSGDVLITGGLSYGGIGIFYGSSATAEIYHPPSPPAAPALFSISGDGRGQGAVWHASTGQIVSAQHPAAAGEILALYTNNLFEGDVAIPLVTVGAVDSTVLYFGTTPSYPGYYQVNFVVPNGIAAGDSVPVRLSYMGRASNQVTIGVAQ